MDAKKAVNRVKATLDKRRGPARKDQGTAPIVDALRDYWARDMLTFAIPAHNGGRGPLSDIASLIGHEAVRHDLPMSHGVDTRDRAWQVRATAQQLFAEAVGAKQTLFSTSRRATTRRAPTWPASPRRVTRVSCRS
jgi:arginine/lysine/ornithine decarboxylase